MYDVSESEYVRKAEVDDECKETRLQGLKDRLAVSDDPEADILRQEVNRLEQEIEELTEFSPGVCSRRRRNPAEGIAEREWLLGGGEDADSGVVVTLAFGSCTVVAEEGVDALDPLDTLKYIGTLHPTGSHV